MSAWTHGPNWLVTIYIYAHGIAEHKEDIGEDEINMIIGFERRGRNTTAQSTDSSCGSCEIRRKALEARTDLESMGKVSKREAGHGI